MHSSRKVFAQKPAGVSAGSLGSAGLENSRLLALQILLSLFYLESQPVPHPAWGLNPKFLTHLPSCESSFVCSAFLFILRFV